MTIKSGQTTGLLAVTTTDTVLATAATGTSREFYSAILHNTSATDTLNIGIFLSSDTTSASGERIDYITLTPNTTHRMYPVLVAPTFNLLAKADVIGATFTGIYTLRNGVDV